MIETKDQTSLTYDFSSWLDLVNYAETTPKADQMGTRSMDRGEKKFFGTDSWEESVEIFHKGWPLGVKKALAISQEIERQLYSLVELPRINYEVCGELLDVGRYCSGVPEHWGVWQSDLLEGKGTKHVHIVINTAVSWQVSTDTIIGRGATVGALINLMELSGYRCKVTQLSVSATGSHKFMCRTVVKEYDEVLDLDRLILGIAHPAAQRRLQFKVRETIKDPEYRPVATGGYGIPDDCEDKDKGDIYFERMLGSEDRWLDTRKCLDYTKRKLVELGVIKDE